MVKKIVRPGGESPAYKEWFAHSVEQGKQAADEGMLQSRKDIKSRWESKRNSLALSDNLE